MNALGRPVQTRLKMVRSKDACEQEADRIADRMMNAPGNGRGGPGRFFFSKTLIRRRAIGTRSAVETVPPELTESLHSSGQPLGKAVRDFMEPRFGHDFSAVRVHHDQAAQTSADAAGAKALTAGRNIVFGTGHFAPDTFEGKRLLAHELTHVIQQENGGGEVVQRDLAIDPPRPNAVGRALGAAEMADAIAFNNRVLGSIANSTAIIRMVRDVIGISPLPAIVDADFVNAVVRWQANFRLGQDGKLGPRTARPLFREIGAEGGGRGRVRGAPRYNPAGPINVPRAAPRVANFTMSAEFDSDPANGVFPSCCEIRQDIQWDTAFLNASVAAGNGTVPHSGFPAAHPDNSWIEDRDQSDFRYGHRTGIHSDPGPGDRYLDQNRQNQAFGHRYEGSDSPEGFAADRGSWRFRLRVIDVCNGSRQLAVSPTLDVNWL